MVERYHYEPYGETTITDHSGSQRSQSAYGNPFMWTGQRYESETGLYHFYARTYSSTLGRWLQRDPLGYIDGVNLYEYVAGSPMNFVDPLGLVLGYVPNPGDRLVLHGGGGGGGSGGGGGGDCANNDGEGDCGGEDADDAADGGDNNSESENQNGNDNSNENSNSEDTADRALQGVQELRDALVDFDRAIRYRWRRSKNRGIEEGFWLQKDDKGNYRVYVDHNSKKQRPTDNRLDLGKPPRVGAVGSVHTHPLPEQDQGPSAQDVATAQRLRLPGAVIVDDPDNPGNPKLIYYDENGRIVEFDEDGNAIAPESDDNPQNENQNENQNGSC